MTTVALVLARGGSKGLPGKNVRPLGGHPLIAWSIVAARLCSTVDRILCSTDSEEIAAIARRYGAETPFLRPAELAGDRSTDLDVFGHAVGWLDAEGESADLLVQLRPTCPFREPGWIDDSVRRMQADVAITCVRSVAEAEHTPYKMWTADQTRDRLTPLLTLEGMSEPYNMPRQSLPKVYRHTGQVDVIRRTAILFGSMTGEAIAPLIVSADTAVDIDTLRDFQLAELILDDVMPFSIRSTIGAAVGALAGQ